MEEIPVLLHKHKLIMKLGEPDSIEVISQTILRHPFLKDIYVVFSP